MIRNFLPGLVGALRRFGFLTHRVQDGTECCALGVGRFEGSWGADGTECHPYRGEESGWKPLLLWASRDWAQLRTWRRAAGWMAIGVAMQGVSFGAPALKANTSMSEPYTGATLIVYNQLDNESRELAN